MILTVNSGSSSIKLALFEQANGVLTRVTDLNAPAAEVPPAERLRSFLKGAGAGPAALKAVAHRVVHGGQKLTRTCRIGAEEEAEIERLSSIAPLHNPPARAWIRTARECTGPEVPHFAVFDTAFFAALPPAAAQYALPASLTVPHGLRRYGFHGTAHRALWLRWRALHPGLEQGGRAITLQLGAGCSAAAIARGRPVETTMGFSPLEGLMMATRAGDVDPGLILHLQTALGWSAERVERLLNRESGLLGVSGLSADMKTLLASREPGAALAVEMFCHRVRKTIGAYLAVLAAEAGGGGAAEGIVFGGGIGEHAAAVRERILAPLEVFGMRLDAEANRAAVALKAGQEARISARDSTLEAWVIPVDEAELLAQEAIEALAAGGSDSKAG